MWFDQQDIGCMKPTFIHVTPPKAASTLLVLIKTTATTTNGSRGTLSS